MNVLNCVSENADRTTFPARYDAMVIDLKEGYEGIQVVFLCVDSIIFRCVGANDYDRCEAKLLKEVQRFNRHLVQQLGARNSPDKRQSELEACHEKSKTLPQDRQASFQSYCIAASEKAFTADLLLMWKKKYQSD
ncbi:hypothetical protein [Aliiroseovarius crassostreae]|uniref:hypothetical protein n=1 Tax=Aliiroseovarius crassostreae TaxID=154981 RepID=UPI003C7D2A6D